MEIILDKKGNAIEAVLDKEEQLALLKENNKRARKYIISKLTQLNQGIGSYDTNGTSNSHLDSSSTGD